MSAIPIRWRLAATFTAVTAVLLTVIGGFLHVRLGAELDGTLRAGLRQRASDLVLVARERGGGLGQGGLNEPGDDIAQIVSPTGKVLDGAPGFRDAPLVDRATLARATRKPVAVAAHPVGDEGDDAALLATPAAGRVVIVGASLEARDDALAKLDGLLLIGFPVGLVLAGIAGFFVAGRALEPVERIRAHADAIGARELGERLPEPRARDELHRLARTLNAMLDRLEAGFARERGFVADASHELRTPLATLKAELELAQRPGRSPSELRAAITSAAEETDRLVRLAENLLVVARADEGQLKLRRQRVDLPDLIRDAARHAHGPVEIIAPSALEIDADLLRLRQALDNLLDNAWRHGAPPITARVTTTPTDVRISIDDAGPGVPDAFADHAFERFTRGDDARHGSGAGLGLAIVAAIAEAHGGQAGLNSSHDSDTTTAWITLPRPAVI